MPIFIEKGSQLLPSAIAAQKESINHEKAFHANSLLLRSSSSTLSSVSSDTCATTAAGCLHYSSDKALLSSHHYLTRMEDMADVLKLDVYITKDPTYNDRSLYNRYKAMKDPSFRLIGKDLIYSNHAEQELIDEEEQHFKPITGTAADVSPSKKPSLLQRFKYLRKQHANDMAHDETKDFLTIVNESNSTVKAIKAGKPIHTRDQPVSLQEALIWSINHVRYLGDEIVSLLDGLDDDIREHLLKQRNKKSPPRPQSPGKYSSASATVSARMTLQAYGTMPRRQGTKDKITSLAKQLDKLALENRESFLSAISHDHDHPPQSSSSHKLPTCSQQQHHELREKLPSMNKSILRSTSPPATVIFSEPKPTIIRSRPHTAQPLHQSQSQPQQRPSSSASSKRRVSRNILKDFQNGNLNLEDLELSFQDGKFLQSIHDNFKQTMRPVLREIEDHQQRIDHLQQETSHKLAESECLGMKMLDQYHDFHLKYFAHRKHVEKIVHDKDFFSDHKLSLKRKFLERRIQSSLSCPTSTSAAGSARSPRTPVPATAVVTGGGGGVDGMVVMHQLESYMNHHEKYIQLEYLSKVPWIGRMLTHLKEIKHRSGNGSILPIAIYRILAVYCHVIMLGFIDSKVFTKSIFYTILEKMIDEIADYQNSIVHRILSLMRESFHVSHHEFARYLEGKDIPLNPELMLQVRYEKVEYHKRRRQTQMQVSSPIKRAIARNLLQLSSSSK
jgi:hypothetical protein